MCVLHLLDFPRSMWFSHRCQKSSRHRTHSFHREWPTQGLLQHSDLGMVPLNISMSYAYNRRIRKSPPSNCFTNKQWLACVLWYLWLAMIDSKFRYHFRGACFSRYRLFLNRHTKFSFPFFMILLVAAYRFLSPNLHAKRPSWHPWWPLCSTPFKWMSFSLLGQKSRWNPLLSSARSPVRQFGHCILDSCHLPVSTCTPTYSRVPFFLLAT